MNFKQLLKKPPLLHNDDAGNLISWQLEDDIANYINKTSSKRSKTLETGAGLSTIIFALNKCDHTCVCPDLKQILRIKKFCKENEISLEHVKFIKEISEIALPKLSDRNYDLVFIDGRHAFPTPFIDWYYLTPKLKKRGILIIDDTQLWTGEILMKFLLSEEEWKLESIFSRSVAFKKIKEGSHLKEWTAQPFIVKSSELGIRKEQLIQVAKLLKKRRFNEVLQKSIKKFI